MKATIVFNNDPSVGIFGTSYQMELPFEEFADEQHKEEVRKDIKDFYTMLEGEFICSYVIFEGETFD